MKQGLLKQRPPNRRLLKQRPPNRRPPNRQPPKLLLLKLLLLKPGREESVWFRNRTYGTPRLCGRMRLCGTMRLFGRMRLCGTMRLYGILRPRGILQLHPDGDPRSGKLLKGEGRLPHPRRCRSGSPCNRLSRPRRRRRRSAGIPGGSPWSTCRTS